MPLPALAPIGTRSVRTAPAASKQGSTAAARRLRASRSGRISTANYRPLPPVAASTATDVHRGCYVAGFRPDRYEGQRQPQPHQVRFGDILGFHCSAGQLTALDPTERDQPAASATWAFPQWAMTPHEGSNAVDGGQFEVHPSGEWSKQRAFSGAVRQVSVKQVCSLLSGLVCTLSCNQTKLGVPLLVADSWSPKRLGRRIRRRNPCRSGLAASWPRFSEGSGHAATEATVCCMCLCIPHSLIDAPIPRTYH